MSRREDDRQELQPTLKGTINAELRASQSLPLASYQARESIYSSHRSLGYLPNCLESDRLRENGRDVCATNPFRIHRAKANIPDLDISQNNRLFPGIPRSVGISNRRPLSTESQWIVLHPSYPSAGVPHHQLHPPRGWKSRASIENDECLDSSQA